MNIDELNTWISTDDGRKWLDEQKRGLIEKRDELLQKVKELNEDHRKATDQVNDLTNTLTQERESYRKEIIDREVSSFVDRHVVPGLREGARALFSSIDIDVKADGQQRIPIVGKESLQGLPIEGDIPESMSLRDYLDAWSKTEDAKSYLKAPDNSGGGARGSWDAPSEPTEDAFTKAVLEKL